MPSPAPPDWPRLRSSCARSQRTISDRPRKIKVRIEEEQRAAEALVAAASAREGALQQQLATIDADRYLAVERLRAVRRELETVELEVFDINQAIGRLNVSLANETGILERKARSLYKAGRTSILETALAADSFADVLDRAASLERLLSRDIADIDHLRDRRREVQLRTADLTARLDRQQELRAEAESIEAELAHRSEEQRDRIIVLQDDLAALAADVAAFKAESDAISYRISLLRDIRQRELDELERRRAGPYVWPLVGLITTEYGGCTFGLCPHWGIDISASEGTPIVASNGGVVLEAGLVVPGDRHASYGMIVIIAHSASEETETLYAHLAAAGGAGTIRQPRADHRIRGTHRGWTTGPHLQFEYRVDGFAQNPRNVLG